MNPDLFTLGDNGMPRPAAEALDRTLASKGPSWSGQGPADVCAALFSVLSESQQRRVLERLGWALVPPAPVPPRLPDPKAPAEFPTDLAGIMAPWPDFAGHPIYEGDTLRHPDGTEGVVRVERGGMPASDRWRVDYGDGKPWSRLVLQIGYKGRAVVVKATAGEWSPEALDRAARAAMAAQVAAAPKP